MFEVDHGGKGVPKSRKSLTKAHTKVKTKRSAKPATRTMSRGAKHLMDVHSTYFSPLAEGSDAFNIVTMFDYSVPGVITDHS